MSDNRYFNPEGVAPPAGAYTHIAEYPPASRVLYTAGQVGVARDGTFPEDFRQQVENTWQNLIHVLGDDKMTANDIVKVVHYLDDAANLAAYRETYPKYLGSIAPASTLLVIKQLARPSSSSRSSSWRRRCGRRRRSARPNRSVPTAPTTRPTWRRPSRNTPTP